MEYQPYFPADQNIRGTPGLFTVILPAELLEPGEVVVLRGHFAEMQWEWPLEQHGDIWSATFDGLDGVALGDFCATGIFQYKYFIINHGSEELPEYEMGEGCNWRAVTSYVKRYFNVFEPNQQLAVRNPQASNMTPVVTRYLLEQVQAVSNTTSTLDVTVPEGAEPGDILTVDYEGRQLQVRVPATKMGFAPTAGTTFQRHIPPKLSLARFMTHLAAFFEGVTEMSFGRHDAEQLFDQVLQSSGGVPLAPEQLLSLLVIVGQFGVSSAVQQQEAFERDLMGGRV